MHNYIYTIFLVTSRRLFNNFIFTIINHICYHNKRLNCVAQTFGLLNRRFLFLASTAAEHMSYCVVSSAVLNVVHDDTVFGVCQAVLTDPRCVTTALGCNSNHSTQNMKVYLWMKKNDCLTGTIMSTYKIVYMPENICDKTCHEVRVSIRQCVLSGFDAVLSVVSQFLSI